MPRSISTPVALSPGQAQYVLERLLRDRRVSLGEVARYAADIEREIAEIERRLAVLRDASGTSTQREAARQRDRRAPEKQATPKRRKRRGNRLAGSYMGYMRQVAPEKKAKYQTIKQEKGFAAAIAALRADLGK